MKKKFSKQGKSIIRKPSAFPTFFYIWYLLIWLWNFYWYYSTICSSESDENKTPSVGSSQSSIDSFFIEIVNEEEQSDTEKYQYIQENENIGNPLPIQNLNKSINSDSEDFYEDNSSGDESFYSFESDDNVLERKVSFGSIKSLLHKSDTNLLNEGKI